MITTKSKPEATKQIFVVPLINPSATIIKGWEEEVNKDEKVKMQKFVFPKPRRLKNSVAEIYAVAGIYHPKGEWGIQCIDNNNNEDVKKLSYITVSNYDEEAGECPYYGIWTDLELEKTEATFKQMQHMAQPMLGVGSFIYRLNKGRPEFLLSRRVKGPLNYINLLSNFGGAVDLGESYDDALRREIAEEIGLQISEDVDLNLIHTDTTVVHMDGQGYIYHAFSLTYSYMLSHNETVTDMEPHKTRDFGWYSIDHLTEHPEDLTPLCRAAFQKWLEQYYQVGGA